MQLGLPPPRKRKPKAKTKKPAPVVVDVSNPKRVLGRLVTLRKQKASKSEASEPQRGRSPSPANRPTPATRLKSQDKKQEPSPPRVRVVRPLTPEARERAAAARRVIEELRAEVDSEIARATAPNNGSRPA